MRLLAIALLFCGGLSAAEFEGCPARIDVQPQELAKTAPGWTAAQAADARHELWFVTLYEGEPKEKASLVPDLNGALRQGWLLPRQNRPYWIECHYTRTTIVLAKALPATVQSCQAVFEPSVTIDGHPAIKTIECR